MADRLSKEKRSKIMSAIRSKDTKVEWILRSALWKEGLRYRLHKKGLPGRPDIVFPKEKVAVFVDGDFWHGHNWKKLRPKLKNQFWIDKIKRNRKRDKQNTLKLESLGWKVIRVWEHELREDCKKVVNKIRMEIKNV